MTNKILITFSLLMLYFLISPVATEENFIILSNGKIVGNITTKTKTEILNNKKFYYVETFTISTVNRWFPGKEVITIDKEYLDENYQVVWFESEIIYKDKKIRLIGETKKNILHLTKYDHTGKIETKTTQLKDMYYTSGALRFLYKTFRLLPSKTFNIYLFDRRYLKWRKIKLKVNNRKIINLNGRLVEVYPVEKNYGFLSSISYIDENGNLLYSNGRNIEIKKVE